MAPTQPSVKIMGSSPGTAKFLSMIQPRKREYSKSANNIGELSECRTRRAKAFKAWTGWGMGRQDCERGMPEVLSKFQANREREMPPEEI